MRDHTETGQDAAVLARPFDALPLSDAIGAEIRGLDLRVPLDAATVEAVREAWREYTVLLFRDQRITDTDLVRLTRQFGEPEIAPLNDDGRRFVEELPEILIISNVLEGGRQIGSLGNTEAMWHSDLNFMKEPPAGSFLYSLEVPPEGGDTGFLNMYEALEAMPPDLHARIEGKKIKHDATYNSAGLKRAESRPAVEHPIIRTHPETGRKTLYLGRRLNAAVAGLPPEESETLLDALWAHATQGRFAWHHKWRAGDLLIWDNRCTTHRRDGFDAKYRRVMHRTQTRGTRPY